MGQNNYRRDILKASAATFVSLTAGCAGALKRDDRPSTSPGQTPTSTSTETKRVSTTSRAELEQRITELEQEVTTLERRLDEKNNTVTDLQTQLTTQKEQVKTLETKLINKSERIYTLEQKVKTKEQRIEEIKKQADNLSEYSADIRETALQVGKRIRQSVVFVETLLDQGGSASNGTGWFIDDHHIVTNKHVIHHANEPNTEQRGYTVNKKEFSWEVVGESDSLENDVALLRTDHSAPYTPPLGSSNDLDKGQPALQVGHPSLIGNWVIALGEYREPAEYGNNILFEMPSTKGNSGSPVVNLDGEVVGITSQGKNRNRDFDDGKPKPYELTVFEEYPYQEEVYLGAETIETVQNIASQWL